MQSKKTSYTRISHTPGVCGGAACVRQTRIPVWALFALWNQRATDHEVMDAYPALTQQDLDEARGYIHKHLDEIVNDYLSQREDDLSN